MTLARGAIVAALLVSGMALPASPGMPNYWDAQGLLGHHPDAIVAVVTVADAVRGMGTNDKPPVVALTIDATLRGTLARRQVEVVWWGDSWTDDSLPPREWSSKPAFGPMPGSRLIVALLVYRKGVLDNDPLFRFPDTPEKRKEIRGWIADDRRARRQMAREMRAARSALDARVRTWRNGIPRDAIARSAREADFVGVGHVGGGPNAGVADFIVDRILKGTTRVAGIYGRHVMAKATLPPIAAELQYAESKTPFLLFMEENGMDLDREADARRPGGLGIVLADAAAEEIVREAIAATRPPPPLCVVVAMGPGPVGRPAPGDWRARLAKIGQTFVGQGGRRCSIATKTMLLPEAPVPAAEKLAAEHVGVAAAVITAFAPDDTVRVSGLMVAPSGKARAMFTDQEWPAEPAKQEAVARRMLAGLVCIR
jgi:hypothetical protein